MTSISRNLFLFPFLLFVQVGWGQRQEESPQLTEQSRLISFEALPMFGEDTVHVHLNLHYRVAKSFFVFIKNSQSSAADDYAAKGELVVELLDERNASAGREIRPIQLRRTSIPATREQDSDIQGSIEFSVSGGEYQIVFEVRDLESGRSFLERRQKVVAHPPAMKPLELSAPMLVQKPSTDSTYKEMRFMPFNRGTIVPFGASGGFLMQLYLPGSGQPLTVHWKLNGHVEEFGIESQEFEGTLYQVFDGIPQYTSRFDAISYTIARSASSWKTLYLPLPFDALEPGTFTITLEIAAGEAKTSKEQTFKVFWPNRPFSLRTWDLAVDALRHIATEEELDEMNSFSSSRAQLTFRQFWKKRDPDTTTAYNEFLAEYYRRVDESIRRFSTLNEMDGFKTDRGRIFILFGSPTRTERLLRPNSIASEVWIYENAKKRFVFTDANKSGNYVLSQAESF